MASQRLHSTSAKDTGPPLTGAAFTDRKGHVWLGGRGILSRWDGEEFHQLTSRTVCRTATSGQSSRTGRAECGSARQVAACCAGTANNSRRSPGPTVWRTIPCWPFIRTATARCGSGPCYGGVSRFDGTSFVNYSTADGLPENRIHDIHQDENGVLWFGTFNGGLVRFDERRLTRFTTADGLADDHCSSVIADRQTNLWFTTAKGVSRWDGKRFTSLTTADGLADNNVTRSSCGGGRRDVVRHCKRSVAMGREPVREFHHRPRPGRTTT